MKNRRINPNDVNAYKIKAYSLFGLGKYSESVKVLKEAQKLAPNDEEIKNAIKELT